MEGLAILTGVLLRLGVPAALTVVLVWMLRKLDARWQREAELTRARVTATPARAPCWEINKCPPERRARCLAAAHPEIPCWQHFRDRQGHLRETCLKCIVFRAAPAPVAA